MGFVGDGGLATQAMLSYPSGIAVDASDNIFIADKGNNRIRRVDHSTGIIITLAGIRGGARTPYGGFSGDGGPATRAQLKSPCCVALNPSGDLFIADSGNNRVRRVDHTTGIITTVAGNGADSPRPNR
jgi:streptogramin lyase